MINTLYHQLQRPVKAASLILAVLFTAILSYGCAVTNQKYMFGLDSAYIFDSHTGLFVNSSQEYNYSDKTFLTIKNTKQVYQKGISTDYTIPAEHTKSGSEIKFTVGHIVHDGKLCVAPPLTYGTTFNSSHILPDEKSALLVFGNSEFFVINFFENSITPVFSPAISADIVSVSPDGQYILYNQTSDLFAYNLTSGENRMIMNFDNKEFISWNKQKSESFLYREDLTENNISGKRYSDIYTYSLSESTNISLWSVNDEYKKYELINDTYIYIHTDSVLDIINYYTGDLISVDTDIFSTLNDLKLTTDGKYAAMYGLHTNIDGKLITEIISIHLDTNNIISHTEDAVKSFIVDSYRFGNKSDGANVLVINYLDLSTLRYKSEFYNINHKK